MTRPRFSLTDDNAGVVIETCRRLDGLPLGIELAAAKVGLLGAVGVRDRLAARLALPGPTVRDAPGGPRTPNDAVAWSHDLLDRPSQTLFARLAVFAGGCRPEQLEAVCGPSDELGDDILETIARLVDQSLALSIESAHGVRFRMLETIRSFALERLGELSDRGAIARRHALAYMAVAEAGSASVPGRQQRPVLERYAEERDNYRAALRWAIETGEAEVGLRLFVALGWTWGLRGELEEGRAWAAEILGIPGADSPTAWRMRALEAVGTLEYYSGNRDVAERHYRAQLEVAREIGDPLGIAHALFNIPFTGNPVERAPAMMPLF